MSAVVKFVESHIIQPINYFITGNYEGDDGDDNIEVLGGNPFTGDGIKTYGGNDTVIALALKLKVIDTWGNLTVTGAGAYTDIRKSDWGNLTFKGVAGKLNVEHTGNRGDVKVLAAAAYSTAIRKGLSGDMSITSAAAYSSYKLHTKKGNLTFDGASAYLNLERRSNGYTNSSGDVKILGAGAWVEVYSDVDSGDMTGYTVSGNGKFTRVGKNSKVDLKLVGVNNEVYHHSTTGDTKVIALGGRNYIEKKGREEGDDSKGNLDATVAGFRNEILHVTRHGDTTVTGAAISSKITRIGESGNTTIQGLGIDNEINIKMKSGHLDFTGAGASNRINIEGSGQSKISTSSHLSNTIEVLIDEDFESGTATGWSDNTVDTSGTELSNFLGRLGGTNGNQDIHKTYNFGTHMAGEVVKIEFDMYEIDSWDNEYFKVFVNDKMVLDDQLEWNTITGKASKDDLFHQNKGFKEDIHHYSVYVVTDDNGQVKLGFGSTLNSDIDDESYGIDNIKIKAEERSSESFLSYEDFESGVSTGWSHNTVDTSGTELSNFLGRFAGTNGNQGIHKTYNFGAENAGKIVDIEFDMYEIDSWDNEYFKVFVNDTMVANDQLTYLTVTGEATEDNVFHSSGGDEKHQYSIQARVDNNGQVKLGFGSTLNESINTESWGIDNIKITKNRQWSNAPVLNYENFEESDARNGWEKEKDGLLDVTIDNSGTELGKFLGRLGGTSGEQGYSKTYNFGMQHAGKTVNIEFDMYEIDSWDNEYFRVFVNDIKVDDDQLNHWTTTGEAIKENIFHTTMQYPDEKHQYSIDAIVDNNGQVKLGFGSTLDSGIDDESWGIDNIKMIQGDDWQDIIINENFEDSNATSGWGKENTGLLDVTANKSNTELGDFLGRFAGTSGEQGYSKTYDFGIQNAGKLVDISFDMYEIDSWDNEYFRVFVNDAMVLDEQLTYLTITGEATKENVFNPTWGDRDDKHHYDLKVRVDDTGKVKLGFGSTLNENINTESWGIDNVKFIQGDDWQHTLIHENFEESDAKAGWKKENAGLLDVTVDNSGTELGKFLGRLGGTSGEQGYSKTYNFGAQHAGKLVEIEFDMYEIDSWDGESFRVFVNDSMLVNEQMSAGTNTGESTNGNVFGTYEDEIHHYTLQARVDNNGEVKLGFGSTLNQDIENESWGIDNLIIKKSATWDREILFREDFEGSNANRGWEKELAGFNDIPVDTSGTELGKFLGRLGKNTTGQRIYKSYDIGMQHAGKVVDIELDIYEIDSWNGNIGLFVNYEAVFGEHLSKTTKSTENNVFGEGADKIHHYTLQGTVDNNGYVMLSFDSSYVDSWGIDNILIREGAGWNDNRVEESESDYDSLTFEDNNEDYSSEIKLAGLYNKVHHTTEAGDINVTGGGGYSEITREANDANLTATLAGAANNVKLEANTGNFTFTGAGLANILNNNSSSGTTHIVAAGLGNIVNRTGDGDGTLIMVGGANIVKWKGNGDIKAFMLAGANVLLKRNDGGTIYGLMAGGVNYIGQTGSGNIYAGMLGGANVITKKDAGNVYALMAGGLNVLVQVGNGKTGAVMFGGLNVLTKVGDGLTVGALFGAGNVFTHVGHGHSIGAMRGGANIFTKVGGKKNDLTIGVMIGGANIFTHVGHGHSIALMAGEANIFTKIGGRVNGNGLADDDLTLAGMFSIGNIFTHIGHGTTGALMVGAGNVLTKVGNGLTIGVMLGAGNIFTHVGNGTTLGLMASDGNVFTKVGGTSADYTIAAMLGQGNIFTHVGDGLSGAVMLGQGNIFTKVGDGPSLAVMLAPPSAGVNIFTHVGDGISGALMFGGVGNIFTRVGGAENDFTVAAMLGGSANIFTHIGNGHSIAIMALSKANIFTKVGGKKDDLTLAFMQGDLNIMTHVGDGTTVGLAIGKLNIITKVGNDELAVGLYGKANIVTHVSSEKSNTFALVKGNLNVITKVGPMDGFTVTVAPLDGRVADPVAKEDQILPRGDITSNPMGVVNSVLDGMETLVDSTYNDITSRRGGMLAGVVIGDANIITHVGRGSTNVLAHGKANIITKVGNGRSLALANGKLNILTTVGDGDSIQAVKGEANIITKVGSGSSAVIAIGESNVVTKVGDGLHIGIMHGKLNVQTVVGDGMVISAQNGEFNINTRVGDGTNISVAKGKYNLNVQFGDGLGIYAAAGRGNVSIKIGNGDYYGASLEIGGRSAKEQMKTLLSEMYGTAKSVLAMGTISRIVTGDNESTVTNKGHTIPTVTVPTSKSDLKGIAITQSTDTTTNANADDYMKDATRTSGKGDKTDFEYTEESLEETQALETHTHATFTNIEGLTAHGNDLTKTETIPWDTPTYSTDFIEADGSVTTTVDETNTRRMIGLSTSNTGSGLENIGLGIMLWNDGSLSTFDNGTGEALNESYQAGDVLSVKRIGNTITFLKNGDVFYTSKRLLSGKLYVDTVLYDTDATLKNVVMTNTSIETTDASFTNTKGVTVSSNDLTKPNTDAWGHSGASSTQSIDTDGSVTTTIDETNTRRMIGFSYSDDNQHYNDINYAAYMRENATLEVYENGQIKGSFGTYEHDDVISVKRTGTTITYLKNDVVFYTSATASNGRLYVDTALGTDNATLKDVMINSFETVFVPILTKRNLIDTSFTNINEVSVIGNDLRKTGSNGWGTTAFSEQFITADGSVSTTVSETSTTRRISLSNTDYHNSGKMDYSITIGDRGRLGIMENGPYVDYYGHYETGDVLSIQRTGTTITYLKNDEVFYTSLISSSGNLHIDTYFYDYGATLKDIVFSNDTYRYETKEVDNFSDASFTNDEGVTVNGNDLTKPNTDDWGHSGASSTQSIDEDGSVTTTIDETNTRRMIGFSYSDDNQHYNDINYAAYMRENATLQVWETGHYIGSFGTYEHDDVISVKRTGTTITYLKNDVVFYTSTTASNGRLHVDTSLYSTNATLKNVVVSKTQSIETETNFANVHDITVDGNDLKKHNTDDWSSGASSHESIDKNGKVSTTIEETDTFRMIGLSYSDDSQDRADIDYGIRFTGDGKFQAYENGQSKTLHATYEHDDIFVIQRTGDTITYLQNGDVFYTSAIASSGKLYVDTSMYSKDATLKDIMITQTEEMHDIKSKSKSQSKSATDAQNNANSDANKVKADVNKGKEKIETEKAKVDSFHNDINQANEQELKENAEDIKSFIQTQMGNESSNYDDVNDNTTFTNIKGVSVEGNNITKTGARGWNSGAFSTESIDADGSVSTTLSETNTRRMIGFSVSDNNQKNTDIEYAAYFKNRNLEVYEKGKRKGSFGTYKKGDIVSVSRTGTTVSYLKNGKVFYTSEVASSEILYVDTSLDTKGATLKDIVIKNDAFTDFNSNVADGSDLRNEFSGINDNVNTHLDTYGKKAQDALKTAKDKSSSAKAGKGQTAKVDIQGSIDAAKDKYTTAKSDEQKANNDKTNSQSDVAGSQSAANSANSDANAAKTDAQTRANKASNGEEDKRNSGLSDKNGQTPNGGFDSAFKDKKVLPTGSTPSTLNPNVDENQAKNNLDEGSSAIDNNTSNPTGTTTDNSADLTAKLISVNALITKVDLLKSRLSSTSSTKKLKNSQKTLDANKKELEQIEEELKDGVGVIRANTGNINLDAALVTLRGKFLNVSTAISNFQEAKKQSGTTTPSSDTTLTTQYEIAGLPAKEADTRPSTIDIIGGSLSGDDEKTYKDALAELKEVMDKTEKNYKEKQRVVAGYEDNISNIELKIKDLNHKIDTWNTEKTKLDTKRRSNGFTHIDIATDSKAKAVASLALENKQLIQLKTELLTAKKEKKPKEAQNKINKSIDETKNRIVNDKATIKKTTKNIDASYAIESLDEKIDESTTLIDYFNNDIAEQKNNIKLATPAFSKAKKAFENAQFTYRLKEGEPILERIDFHTMFDDILNNEIRTENAKAVNLQEGLPEHLSNVLENNFDGKILEVYEFSGFVDDDEKKEKIYTEILHKETNPSTDSDNKIRVIREGTAGDYHYRVADFKVSKNNGILTAFIENKATSQNKNNSLYEAIDSQLNPDSYNQTTPATELNVVVIDPVKILKAKNSNTSKTRVLDLRSKTAFEVNKTYDKMAGAILTEMNTGSLKLGIGDQVYSSIKTTAVQQGFSYAGNILSKFATGNTEHKHTKRAIGTGVGLTLHSVIGEFIAPSKHLKPEGTQSISLKDGKMYKLAEMAIAVAIIATVCGMVNAAVTAAAGGFADLGGTGEGTPIPGSTSAPAEEYLINEAQRTKIFYAYVQFVLGEMLSGALNTAVKTGLAANDILFKRSEADMKNTVLKIFAEANAMESAKPEVPVTELSMTESFKNFANATIEGLPGFRDKMLNRGFAQAMAHIADAELTDPLKNKENKDGMKTRKFTGNSPGIDYILGEAALFNGFGSAIFNGVHIPSARVMGWLMAEFKGPLLEYFTTTQFFKNVDYVKDLNNTLTAFDKIKDVNNTESLTLSELKSMSVVITALEYDVITNAKDSFIGENGKSIFTNRFSDFKIFDNPNATFKDAIDPTHTKERVANTFKTFEITKKELFKHMAAADAAVRFLEASPNTPFGDKERENAETSLSEARAGISKKFNELKENIQAIKDLRKDGVHNTSLNNALNTIGFIEKGAIKDFVQKIVTFPFDKNREVIFDKDIMAASKIQDASGTDVEEIHLSIEKVYVNEQGEKVILRPYLDVPEGATTITVRQYGNIFTQVIDGKETGIKGQDDSKSLRNNLRVLLEKEGNGITAGSISDTKLASNIVAGLDYLSTAKALEIKGEAVLNSANPTAEEKIAAQVLIDQAQKMRANHNKLFLAGNLPEGHGHIFSNLHLYATVDYKTTNADTWQSYTTEQTAELTRSATEDNDPNKKGYKKPMNNYDHQIIVVTEGEPYVIESAYRLASKHPGESTIVFMDKQGNIEHRYGTEIKDISGKKLRISTVGHGRDDNGEITLGGRNERELALHIKKLKSKLGSGNSIDKISGVGCNIGQGHEHLSETDFGVNLMKELRKLNIITSLSLRSQNVAIHDSGIKGTRKVDDGTAYNLKDSSAKIDYTWKTNNKVTSLLAARDGNTVYSEDMPALKFEEGKHLVNVDRVNDVTIDKNKVGNSLVNNDVTPHDPTGRETKNIRAVEMAKHEENIKKIGEADISKRPNKQEFDKHMDDATSAPKSTVEKIQAAGANIQINVGDGEHTTLYYGSNNIDIKIGDGGHKTAMIGNNNALVSIGDRGTSKKHTVDVGHYTAFEGAQLLVGQRNIAFNHGDRNDFIVMLDKSIPIIPLLNPFDGASGISATLKSMAEANTHEREALWTFDKTKTFSKSMSVLDLTSTVKYDTLLDVGSNNDISDRGIKYDIEASLNNKANGAGGTPSEPFVSIKESAKAKVKKLKDGVKNSSINFTVAGRGSDIVLANGNFSFIFGDNIQSALDTTVASLFGIAQHGYSSTGAPTNTFTFSPKDLQTQLGHSIANRLASITEDITVGELMNYNYTQDGHVYHKDGRSIDVRHMLGELFTSILPQSFGSIIDTMTNPKKILNTVKAMAGTGADMVKNGLGALGLPVENTNETAQITNSIDTSGKVITIDLIGAVTNNLADLAALKEKITLHLDGEEYVTSLGANDSVAIVNGQVRITLATAVTVDVKVTIEKESLKNSSGFVITSLSETTVDVTAPTSALYAIDKTNKIITVDFGDSIVNNLANLNILKRKIKVDVSGNGTATSLSADDKIEIKEGKLLITLKVPSKSKYAKVTVDANSFKNTSGRVITTAITVVSATIGTYQIDTSRKVVTVDFGDSIVNNLANINTLKSKIKVDLNGDGNKTALGSSDTIKIVNGKLVVTFASAITHKLQVSVEANSLKNNFGQVLSTDMVVHNLFEGKAFGFSGLKMPSFFDALKIPKMLTKIPTLVEDLGNSITGDVANMKEKMLTFFTETGYMKDDGDLVVSLGSQNFVWGGHGKDLIALLGVNNNVWAGEGDDVGYLMGEGNTFSGNNGNDTAVMMGQNHMFIGGDGNDVAIASGRYNNLFGGDGNDQLWAFGTRGLITGGSGDDYIVSTGNNHDINAGIGNDFSVSIGSGHKIHLEAGDDQAKVFGNDNHLLGGAGDDVIDVYSYNSVIQTDDGDDVVMARSKSKKNEIYTGDGNDTIFIGGLNNTYSSGRGQDIFVMTNQNIEGRISDITSSDMIVFNNFSYTNLWFEQSGNDLTIHNYNGEGSNAADSQDWFEEFGALTVDDYFENNAKRAAIVTSVKTDVNGEIVEYEYLDNNAFDKLVEIMASSDRTVGSDGFMSNKSNDFKDEVSLAWSQRSDATRTTG